MMKITVENLLELGKSPQHEFPLVNFSLKLRRPHSFGYEINTLFPPSDPAGKELFEEKMALQGGIEASYVFRASGVLSAPQELKGEPCSLVVNRFRLSDHINNEPFGRIGTGRKGLDDLEFHLAVTPQAARDIIEFPKIMKSVIDTNGVLEEDWLSIRLDGCNFSTYLGDKDRIVFDIKRAFLMDHS